MKKKGNLFALIKSLESSEKRYFKLFCSESRVESNYLRLFDLIDKQDVYDESKIRKTFKGETFLKQMHVTKIYLSDLILRALRNYHRNISRHAQILDLLRDIEVLFSKELYDQCLITILKAEKLAEKFERFGLGIEIANWKRKINLSIHGNHSEILLRVINEEKEVIAKSEQLNQYWRCILENSPQQVSRNQFQTISSKELDKQAGIPNSIASALLRHHILYSHGIMGQRPRQAETELTTLINLLEQNPHLIKDDPGPYINSLNNMITFLVFEKRYENTFIYLEKIRKVPATYGLKKRNKLTIRSLTRSYNVELEIYRDLKQFDQAVRLMETVSEFLAKYESLIELTYKVLIWNQFAQIHFSRQDFSGSLIWVNKIMSVKSNVRMDIQRYARIMHLVIHFDLGNVVFMRYAIESCRKFYRKTGQTSRFEKTCLFYFSKLSRIGISDYKRILAKFYSVLFEGESPVANPSILDYIDLRTWLNKKLEHTID